MSDRQERIIIRFMPDKAIRCYDKQKKTPISEWQIQCPDNAADTVVTVAHGKVYMKENEENKMAKKYRIRKLTSKECYRLMGFTDKDYKAAESVISESQRYKTAGNSIVKQVLMAIFLQMGIQGKKKWNEMSVEERQNLVDNSLDFI